MIECTGFHVKFHGDSSVGIFDQTWTINGYFIFESEEDFMLFKDKLIMAWEYASDTPITVMSFEEYNKYENT